MIDCMKDDRRDRQAAEPLALSTSALRKEAFLHAFRSNGFIGISAKMAGVTRNGADYWRKTDPEFAKQFEVAKQEFLETMEAEADRRARGWEEPVFNKDGEQIGVKPKHSDLMLIFRLKALAPEKYAEKRQVNQNVNVQLNPFQSLTPAQRAEELSRLQAIAARCQPS